MMKWMRYVGLIVLILGSAPILAQDQAEDADASIAGTIAYIGADFNAYTIDLESGEPIQLTVDAGFTDDLLRYYQWPTWSRAGQLAIFGNLLTASGQTTTEIYVVDAEKEALLLYTGVNEVFNYAAWSPSSRDLAVLLSSVAQNNLIVQMVRGQNSVTVGGGQPFYYSFSPDGAQMLLQRNNARLDIYDVEDAAITSTLEQRPGAFYAPAWSPVDDRLLFGARGADERSTDLVIAADDAITTLATGLVGPVYFSWAPDGASIAYSDRRGGVVVLDARTGETMMRGASSGVLAFFWSPDSTQIAYVTVAAPPGSFSVRDAVDGRLSAQNQPPPALSWTVMEVASGDSQRYSSFVPSRDLIYLFTYFDQFAQSHSLWSPDSRYLVYSAIIEENRSVITVLDVSDQVGVPRVIADGLIGVWSYR